MAFNTLLIGGRGTIGSGLRRYLPEMDERYRFCSIDLPGAPDRAEGRAEGRFIYMDITEEPDRFRDLLPGFDLVVYLARKGDLAVMNHMTDLVFESVLALDRRPMIVGSSSVHAVDDAYRFFESGTYALIAERKFDEIVDWPPPLSAHTPPCPINDYGREKAYVEAWVKRASERGCGALATRWGGVNPGNTPIMEERGYFAVWCHQRDAASMVHAAYTAHRNGSLPSARHYFVISDNTYNIFDIETPMEEIGYAPRHNAESCFPQSSDRRA
ncbi:MAG: NAD-dependent epimerase/dehydratase family protein [Gemmatimonadetes bacterium]|nr:NAD-dependent epimerase/dehydratase family protein [Gemmatimonadota bacterium]